MATEYARPGWEQSRTEHLTNDESMQLNKSRSEASAQQYLLELFDRDVVGRPEQLRTRDRWRDVRHARRAADERPRRHEVNRRLVLDENPLHLVERALPLGRVVGHREHVHLLVDRFLPRRGRRLLLRIPEVRAARAEPHV